MTDGDPLALEPVGERPRLAEQALVALRRAVVDGRLRTGELYSVLQLAERLGVSRTPVREALLVLERQGLVRFERNRGVRVLQSSAHDLDEVFDLRLLLEAPTARRAAQRLQPEDVEALQATLDQAAAHAAADDEAAFMACDRQFHDRLLHVGGNRRLVATVAALHDLVRLRGVSTVGRGRDFAAILAEHEAILAALRDRDPDAAEAAMRTHLVNTRRLLVEAP